MYQIFMYLMFHIADLTVGQINPKGPPMYTIFVQNIENILLCEWHAYAVVPFKWGKVMKYEAKCKKKKND